MWLHTTHLLHRRRNHTMPHVVLNVLGLGVGLISKVDGGASIPGNEPLLYLSTQLCMDDKVQSTPFCKNTYTLPSNRLHTGAAVLVQPAKLGMYLRNPQKKKHEKTESVSPRRVDT